MSITNAEQYAISSGHGLATDAGLAVLEAGGNAIDAGCAAGIALGVLHSDLVNVAGVAPIMIRDGATGRIVTIDGLGVWPRAATAEYFEREHGGAMPQGIMRTVVPAAPDAWITALAEFGTMSFADVAQYACKYAAEGFPAYQLFVDFITNNEAAYQRYAANAAIYLPGGKPPVVGDTFVQTDLGRTLQYMIDEERAAGGDRLTGLNAARDAFYKGDIAKTICEYHAANGGFLTMEDMADFKVRHEEPIKVPFGGTEIYTCGPWCQGISLAQMFRLIDGMDFAALGHNSPAYIHTLTEALKLVFADREAHVADPLFVDVPVDGLLSGAYQAARREMIDPAKAWPDMPSAGNPADFGADLDRAPEPGIPHAGDAGDAHAFKDPAAADTSYVAAMDKWGNVFSATPSDSSADTEVIPGTGLCPSSRGSQSRGTTTSPNRVDPGKRPRLTPNPAMAFKDGKPFMAFGTPGGDVQVQAMVQVYLNATVFGMNLQAAINAPRFATYSFPSSFAPNDHYPGLMTVEARLEEEVGDALRALGHKAQAWPDNIWKAGGVLAVMADAETGTFTAAADPRRVGTAGGR